MNSSSPQTTEIDYQLWKAKYPSAISHFRHITQKANGKNVILFLDYDGTLSPIVADLERAHMSSEMRSTIKNVAKYFPTAIISGRSRDKVQQFIRIDELYFAGSHGMDIVGPNQVSLYQPEAATEILRIIDMTFKSLTESTKHIIGAKVEDNQFCLSVHYRNVDTEESVKAVKDCVDDIIKAHPNLESTDGLKVFEIRPKIQWNKGNAVEHLLGLFGADVFPIYIGDDRTDEDAFKFLKKNLGRGCGIVVSTVPKESLADYSLRNPLEVRDFLECLGIWMAEESD